MRVRLSMENDIILITTEEAIKAAMRGVRDYGLERNPDIVSAISIGKPDTPLLVKRLDVLKQAYYLVPWVIEEGTVLIAEVDASNGSMRSAARLPKAVPHLFLSPDEALTLVSRKFPSQKLGKPLLVWQPCRETTSPLRPLYEIPYEDGILYVDMDGSIFSSLTPLNLGG